MGIIDDFLDGMKSFSKNIEKEAKGAKGRFDLELRRKIENRRLRIQVLDKFSIDELRDFCIENGMGEPVSEFLDPYDGKLFTIKLNRNHYIDHISVSGIELERIISFARSHKIKVDEVLDESVMFEYPSMKKNANKKKKRAEIKFGFENLSPAQAILESISENFTSEKKFTSKKEILKYLNEFLSENFDNILKKQGRSLVDFEIMGVGLTVIFPEKNDNLAHHIEKLLPARKNYDSLAILIYDKGNLKFSEFTYLRSEFEDKGVFIEALSEGIPDKKKGHFFRI